MGKLRHLKTPHRQCGKRPRPKSLCKCRLVKGHAGPCWCALCKKPFGQH